MGTFTQKLTIRGTGSNGSSGKTVTVDALVDTGAMFSSVPAPVLEELGVKPFRTMPVKFANGQSAQIPMGEVQAEVDGQTMPILVCSALKACRRRWARTHWRRFC